MFFCAAPVSLPFDLGQLVERERQKVGLKVESLAGLAGMSRQHYMQCVAGQRDFQFRRLLMVNRDPDGRRFFKGLMLSIFSEVGIEDRDQIAAMLRGVIDAFQGRDGRESARMAKAELRPAQEEKRIA